MGNPEPQKQGTHLHAHPYFVFSVGCPSFLAEAGREKKGKCAYANQQIHTELHNCMDTEVTNRGWCSEGFSVLTRSRPPFTHRIETSKVITMSMNVHWSPSLPFPQSGLAALLIWLARTQTEAITSCYQSVLVQPPLGRLACTLTER